MHPTFRPLGLLSSLAVLAACQSQPATAPALPAATPLTAAAPQDTLLSRYDLAPLLRLQPQPEGAASGYAYQGFVGLEHRRIEVRFADVRRDAARPAVYAVRGKYRYNGAVTPFVGTITFERVLNQPRYVARPTEPADEGEFDYPGTGHTCNECAMYTAVGQFQLRSALAPGRAAICRGRLALDWQAPPAGPLRVEYRTDSTLTRGGGIRFEGRWQLAADQPAQSVLWVQDIEGFANTGAAPLPELVLNGGDPAYNPRYAPLGWTGHLDSTTGWAR